MKWLIWTPAIVTVLAAVAVPGGLVLFGLPLLALGYFVVAAIALGGSDERPAATRATAVREQRETASQGRRKRVLRRQRQPARAGSSPPLPDSAA